MIHFEKFPYWQKNPCYPPLFQNNEYMTDFKKKAELFNSIFANQRSLINNCQIPPTLSYKANERLSSVKVTDDDILKIIAKLDPKKPHSPDKISIRMIKICSTSICKPLRLTFNHYLYNGIYPCEWTKADLVPIHKKRWQINLKKLLLLLFFELLFWSSFTCICCRLFRMINKFLAVFSAHVFTKTFASFFYMLHFNW